MKDTLKNLLKVKSIVTILLTGIFSYLAIVGKISEEQFMLVFAMVITYYFNKDKKEE